MRPLYAIVTNKRAAEALAERARNVPGQFNVEICPIKLGRFEATALRLPVGRRAYTVRALHKFRNSQMVHDACVYHDGRLVNMTGKALA